MSVVEHLWEPEQTLEHFSRVLRPGGVCAVNVPSWRGKRALEYSAFRLGLSPAEEMDDHKMYYDPKDLWPLMVKAGFMPHAIKCFKHKFGLNTFAVATVTTQESRMTFTQDFLRETVELVAEPRHGPDREDGHRHRGGPRAGRAAVHPRRRAARPARPATPSTTSARSARSSPTPPSTTSPS